MMDRQGRDGEMNARRGAAEKNYAVRRRGEMSAHRARGVAHGARCARCAIHKVRYVPYFTYLTVLNVSKSAVEKVRKKGNNNEKEKLSFPTSEG